jgi:hypothetical protein
VVHSDNKQSPLRERTPQLLTAVPVFALTAPKNGTTPAKASGYVLNELIIALMHKGTLTEEEGKTMLLRLLHRDFLP